MALDPDSQQFREEVDGVVRRWAGDEREYWRRWKQLGTWSMDKTQGDVVKKSALKELLMKRSGGRCEDCEKEYPREALQMHRLDRELAHDRARNFGYVDGNVVLLCATCHSRR